jgi:hypothetical protein
MKNLVFLMGTFFLSALLMADPLATEVSSMTDNIDARTKIMNLYKKELSKEGSPLSVAIRQIEENEGFPDLGSIEEIKKQDLFLTSTGRGSAQSAHQVYLLGIEASRKGSGLIQEHIAYIRASIFLSLLDETETVVLEKFVVISDK